MKQIEDFETRIIIAGSRKFTNYEKLESEVLGFLDSINSDDLCIISGGAKGADWLGEQFAKNHNIPLFVFKANWDKYGKMAGPIRNREMAKYATHLIVFIANDSKGSKDMYNVAIENSIISKRIFI